MVDLDEWGRDPAVKGMRRIFSEMEARHKNLLWELSISSHDPRLRRWREQALSLFNHAWSKASRLKIAMDPGKVGSMYAAGFLKILRKEGILPPATVLSDDADIEMLLKEVED